MISQFYKSEVQVCSTGYSTQAEIKPEHSFEQFMFMSNIQDTNTQSKAEIKVLVRLDSHLLALE